MIFLLTLPVEQGSRKYHFKLRLSRAIASDGEAWGKVNFELRLLSVLYRKYKARRRQSNVLEIKYTNVDAQLFIAQYVIAVFDNPHIFAITLRYPPH